MLPLGERFRGFREVGVERNRMPLDRYPQARRACFLIFHTRMISVSEFMFFPLRPSTYFFILVCMKEDSIIVRSTVSLPGNIDAGARVLAGNLSFSKFIENLVSSAVNGTLPRHKSVRVLDELAEIYAGVLDDAIKEALLRPRPATGRAPDQKRTLAGLLEALRLALQDPEFDPENGIRILTPSLEEKLYGGFEKRAQRIVALFADELEARQFPLVAEPAATYGLPEIKRPTPNPAEAENVPPEKLKALPAGSPRPRVGRAKEKS